MLLSYVNLRYFVCSHICVLLYIICCILLCTSMCSIVLIYVIIYIILCWLLIYYFPYHFYDNSIVNWDTIGPWKHVLLCLFYDGCMNKTTGRLRLIAPFIPELLHLIHMVFLRDNRLVWCWLHASLNRRTNPAQPSTRLHIEQRCFSNIFQRIWTSLVFQQYGPNISVSECMVLLYQYQNVWS